MKCQILFSGKNKKNIINLSSAELAQSVVKITLIFIEVSCNSCRVPYCKVFPFSFLAIQSR